MGILSNTKWQEALAKGWIKVTPAPDEADFDVTSVNVRLDSIIIVIEPWRLRLWQWLRTFGKAPLFIPAFDDRKMQITDFWERYGRKVDLRNGDYKLRPGQFILAMTYETVELPTDGERVFQGAVYSRSRNAREGLDNQKCAPKLKPGTKNKITLEIKNNAPFSIILYFLKGIGQIEAEEVDSRRSRWDTSFTVRSRPQVLATAVRHDDDSSPTCEVNRDPAKGAKIHRWSSGTGVTVCRAQPRCWYHPFRQLRQDRVLWSGLNSCFARIRADSRGSCFSC